MIARQVPVIRALSRVWLSRHALAQVLGLLPAGLLVWWIAGLQVPSVIWAGLVSYSMVQLGMWAVRREVTAGQRLLLEWMALGFDLLLGALIVLEARAVGHQIYPLYLLLALRALAVYQRQPLATISPFLLGPAYLFADSVSRQAYPPEGALLSAQWLLLLGNLAFGVVAIVTGTRAQRASDQLRHELADAQQAAERRVSELERTASDLRARMRDRHALEEGLRAITSSLSLTEVLGQIVDSTNQMLGRNRAAALALSLRAEGVFVHHTADADAAVEGWAETLAERAMRLGTPLIIADSRSDASLRAVLPAGVRAALSVPLYTSGDAPRGALTVLSSEVGAFSSSDARHLNAFVIQAGIAIGNAELHSQIAQQQEMLQAVVRDINDGLVVLDAANKLVLTNATAAELLVRESDEVAIVVQVRNLTERLRRAGVAQLTAELPMRAPSGDELVYQAIASVVGPVGSPDALVAVVLRDITSQKAEERSRHQFISMVAHELRNPLNSLNGFVKLVLQGRAGQLNPMQVEFLGIADSQIDLLKGRIAELLEYNRGGAGQLALSREPSDLALLTTATVTRLRLQAEQAGLTLSSQVPNELPSCLCDSGRIGQVLTNLIENAIKATPPTGSIHVQAEQQEHEIWFIVTDTGVGISLDDQRRIFEPFVQGRADRARRENNLGLGLAICKQIVEGHGGRIWVESALGEGSSFCFTLPVSRDIPSARERSIGA